MLASHANEVSFYAKMISSRRPDDAEYLWGFAISKARFSQLYSAILEIVEQNCLVFRLVSIAMKARMIVDPLRRNLILQFDESEVIQVEVYTLRRPYSRQVGVDLALKGSPWY